MNTAGGSTPSMTDASCSGAPDNGPVRVAIELAAGSLPDELARHQNSAEIVKFWTDLTEPGSFGSPARIVRTRATDLRDAQRKTAQVRAVVAARGDHQSSVQVFVDLDVMIACNSSLVRTDLSRLFDSDQTRQSPRSLAYIGTPKGLAGLIQDIHAAEVADGVTLVPRTANVFYRIIGETIPCLEAAGLHISQSQVDVLWEYQLRHHEAAAALAKTLESANPQPD